LCTSFNRVGEQPVHAYRDKVVGVFVRFRAPATYQWQLEGEAILAKMVGHGG
jgi:hypothetical protein